MQQRDEIKKIQKRIETFAELCKFGFNYNILFKEKLDLFSLVQQWFTRFSSKEIYYAWTCLLEYLCFEKNLEKKQSCKRKILTDDFFQIPEMKIISQNIKIFFKCLRSDNSWGFECR